MSNHAPPFKLQIACPICQQNDYLFLDEIVHRGADNYRGVINERIGAKSCYEPMAKNDAQQITTLNFLCQFCGKPHQFSVVTQRDGKTYMEHGSSLDV